MSSSSGSGRARWAGRWRANSSIRRRVTRRRQQRLAAGDGADPVGELVGRGVLEQEAAGAGLQRVVDVLVEVVGRQDEHAGRVAGGDPAGRGNAVELGHADVHEHDVGRQARDAVDGLVAVRRLADDLDVGVVLEHEPEARPYERLVVGDHDADAHRDACRSAEGGAIGSRAWTRKPPAGAPADVERPAVERDALAHPDEPVPAIAVMARGGPAAVVADLDLHRACLVAHEHASPRPAGVLGRVRQRLLDDPVGGKIDAGRERDRLALHAQLDAQAAVAGAVGERLHRGEAGLRRVRLAVGAAPARAGGRARRAPRRRPAR